MALTDWYGVNKVVISGPHALIDAQPDPTESQPTGLVGKRKPTHALTGKGRFFEPCSSVSQYLTTQDHYLSISHPVTSNN
jgi:hypothetical protein